LQAKRFGATIRTAGELQLGARQRMRAQPVIGFTLDFPTFIVSHLLPHLNRNAAYRIHKAEGPDSLPPSDPQARL